MIKDRVSGGWWGGFHSATFVLLASISSFLHADPSKKDWLNFRLYLLSGSIPFAAEWEEQRLHMNQVLKEGASINTRFPAPYDLELGYEITNGRYEYAIHRAVSKAIDLLVAGDGFRLMNDPENYTRPTGFLLENGADPNLFAPIPGVIKQNEWEHLATPLISAVSIVYSDDAYTCERRKEMVEILLSYQADPLMTAHPSKKALGTARWWLDNNTKTIRSVRQGLREELGKKVNTTSPRFEICINEIRRMLIAAEADARVRQRSISRGGSRPKPKTGPARALNGKRQSS